MSSTLDRLIGSVEMMELSAATALLEWSDGDAAHHLRIHQDAYFDPAFWVIGEFNAKTQKFLSSVVFVVNQLDTLDIA